MSKKLMMHVKLFLHSALLTVLDALLQLHAPFMQLKNFVQVFINIMIENVASSGAKSCN